MSDLNFNKKGVPVILLGLNNAGKTSLALRLVRGEFVDNTAPTLGINYEVYTAGDCRLKIFDVGGHEILRRQFWLNYATHSYGILFVFDASNRIRIEEGKEWFWYLINNLEIENRMTIAFLANKSDLDSMSLEEIVEALDLHKMNEFPQISFQIFKISVKTGANFEDSLNWFTKKVSESTKGREVNPKGMIISNSLGKVRLFLDFTDISDNLTTITEMLAESLDEGTRKLREERVTSVTSSYAQLVFQERGELVISLITEPNDSQVEAQRLVDLVFGYLEEQKASTKEDLLNFITSILEVPIKDSEEIREIII